MSIVLPQRRDSRLADRRRRVSGHGIGVVSDALSNVRRNLGMDVAYVAEFVGDNRCFRYVDADGLDAHVKIGDVLPLEEGYCNRVVDGRLPELIPDTAALPEAMALPVTRQTPIGSHLSVPIRLSDGGLYGTLCCFGFEPDPTLNKRDLAMMRTFADFVAGQIEAHRRTTLRQAERVEAIRALLDSAQPAIYYQPVVLLSDMSVTGAEALSRFGVEPKRTADLWFSEADTVGLMVPLELRAIRNAAVGFGSGWDSGPPLLGVNSSPRTIIEGGILAALEGFPPDRIVLEITEHSRVKNYGELLQALAPLRARGIRVAVDDAGSGYASMRHILNIGPNYIKLDTSLTAAIDTDRTRRALAAALTEFGRQTDCNIIAEGVETAAELATLRELGVYAAQGFHLGRPMPIADFHNRMRS